MNYIIILIFDELQNGDISTKYGCQNAEKSCDKRFKFHLSILFSLEEDLKTGMITLRVKHLSPHIAKRWLDLIIRSINTSLRTSDVEEAKASIDFLNDQRTKTNLVSLDQVFAQLIEEQTKTIMLAHVSEDYVFKVIDPPISPEIKTEPKRAIICIVGTLLGGVISVLLVFGRTFITKESFGFK